MPNWSIFTTSCRMPSLRQYAMASATSLSGTDARFMVTAMALSPSTFLASCIR